jgi:hypothetical protein
MISIEMLDDEILKIAPYSEIFGKNFPFSVKLRWIWIHYKIVIILLLLIIIAYLYKKYSHRSLSKSYVMF